MNSSIFSSDASSLARRLCYGFVLAAIVLTVVASGIRLLGFLDPYYDANSVYARANATLGPSTHILLLGTSHMLAGVNPQDLGGGAVNMAMDGADYQTQLLVLRQQLSRMPSLSVALVEADNFCLFNVGMKRHDYFDLYEWGVARSNLVLEGWSRFYQPLIESPWVAPVYFSRRLTPRAWFWHNELPRVDRGPGFCTFIGQSQEVNVGRERIAAHERGLSDSAASANLAALRSMIELLRAHHVRVIMVTLPHSRDYSDHAGQTWRTYSQRLLDAARAPLGSDFVWWDLDRHPDFVDADFYDGHHLNESGARKLTQLLRSYLSI